MNEEEFKEYIREQVEKLLSGELAPDNDGPCEVNVKHEPLKVPGYRNLVTYATMCKHCFQWVGDLYYVNQGRRPWQG